MYAQKDIDRFYEYQTPEALTGCFLWTGATQTSGYGMVRVGSMKDGTRKSVLAHRMAVELAHGEIPEGKWALHRCDNKACVNPSHLYLGTHADNTRDAVERGLFTGGSLPGTKNPKAKLAERDVLDIRASGRSYGELAEKYGVTKTTIYDIKSGKTWGHLNGIE